MKISKNKLLQLAKLKEISNDKDIDFNTLTELLDSVRTKRIKRNNYHQQKIADIIEQATIK